MAVGNYIWQWPSQGACPSHEGLDSEIFDTERIPHAHTFVREAIQNILDARVNNTSPAKASFKFHSSTEAAGKLFIGDLVSKRRHCSLGWPEAGTGDEFQWLTIEDGNTTGLLGDLTDRKSDFWGYWLNFGRSNKTGEGRGGRGIGRVTFLLASEIHTVLGITRRSGEQQPLCCGMSVLKAEEWKDAFRSSFAYFAKEEEGNIFNLHDSFVAEQLATEFETSSYSNPDQTGLSLIIPYPRPELSEETICAASIENFAPAIIAGDLIINTNHRIIDKNTIKDEARRISEHFRNQSFKEDPASILELLADGFDRPDFTIDIKRSNLQGSLLKALDENLRTEIFNHYDSSESVALKFNVPVKRNDTETTGSVMACARVTPVDQTPTDIFYRGGMYLPDVNTKTKGRIDAFFITADDELNKYLNFCEGKAHLGLLENSEVRDKLRSKGFDGKVTLKRFVNTLPAKLRSLIQPDSSEPDASVFANWFSVSRKDNKKKPERQKKRKVIIDPPPKRESYFIVERLKDGFHIKANAKRPVADWPMNLRIRFAYANGSSRPSWSKFDFRMKELNIVVSNAQTPNRYESEKEKKAGLDLTACTSDFSAVITGFDTRRELVVHYQPLKSESVDNG